MRAGTAVLIAIAAASAGCLESTTVPCDFGICPDGTACDEVHDRCVRPDQLRSCVELPDGTDCTIGTAEAPGHCHGEVCLEAGCNDGVLDLQHEQCDPLDTSETRDACGDIGYYEGGAIACTDQCLWNAEACARRCGDQVNDPEEVCDGASPGLSCVDLGFDAGALGCAPSCAADVGACATFGWQRMSVPTVVALRAAWSPPGGPAYAVGDLGAVVVLERPGDQQWDQVEVPVDAFWTAVWGTAPDDVFLVGRRTPGVPVVIHFDGSDWTQLALPEELDAGDLVSGIWGAAADDVYAVTMGGHILRYRGEAWEVIPDTPFMEPMNAIAGSGFDDIWVGGDSGSLIHWDGQAWNELMIEDPDDEDGVEKVVTSMWSAGPGRIWVIADDVHRYDVDDGVWERLSLPEDQFFTARAVWGSADDDVFVVADGEDIFHWDGDAWATIPTGRDGHLAVTGAGPGAVFAAGEHGVYVHRGFHLIENGDPAMTAVAAIAAGDTIWALTGDNLQRFDGAGWTLVGTGGFGNARDVFRAGPGDFRIGSGSGSVWSGPGGGWTPSDVLMTTVNAVHGTGPDDVFAVGGGGAIAHDDGGGWEIVREATAFDVLYDVWAGDDDVFAVGEAGLTLHLDRNRGGWERIVVGDGPLWSVWGTPGAEVWAVGAAGLMLEWNGAGWTEHTSPVIDDLRWVTGSARDDLVATGAFGSVLHYDGVAWNPIDIGIDLFAPVAAVRPREIMVLGSGSGPSIARVARAVRWTCRARETGCDDRVDDDCDGLRDGDDPDCEAP
ncbi:MAG TPA: hypothetical protein VMZ28_22170 [Kofleriaceae bacterium]|nr:hypothetical protein [Kofleriaceae bacterium]